MLTEEARFWRVLPLMILAHALQTTWLSHVHMGAASLDLPFLVAISTALWGGAARGAVAGAGAGYLAGLAAAWHPGSFLVSRLVPCALTGALAPQLGVSNPLVPPLFAALSALLGDAIFLLFSPGDWAFSSWSSHVLAAMLLNALAIWPVFWLVGRAVRPPKQLMFG